jgi:hypothetical protein
MPTSSTPCHASAATDAPLTAAQIKAAHEHWLAQLAALELVESSFRRKRGVPPIPQIVDALGPDWQAAVGRLPRTLAKHVCELRPRVVALCSEAPAGSQLHSYKKDITAQVDAIIDEARGWQAKAERALAPNASTRDLSTALRLGQRLLRDVIMVTEDFHAVADPGYVSIRHV